MNAQNNKKTDSALNSHQQNMATIAALTATGNTEQLKGVLNAGLAINEIKEALVQLYAYGKIIETGGDGCTGYGNNEQNIHEVA
jgi:alkylhydroperoxidase/carboxymuconolactone decarboxylase family protein YurZ